MSSEGHSGASINGPWQFRAAVRAQARQQAALAISEASPLPDEARIAELAPATETVAEPLQIASLETILPVVSKKIQHASPGAIAADAATNAVTLATSIVPVGILPTEQSTVERAAANDEPAPEQALAPSPEPMIEPAKIKTDFHLAARLAGVAMANRPKHRGKLLAATKVNRRNVAKRYVRMIRPSAATLTVPLAIEQTAIVMEYEFSQAA